MIVLHHLENSRSQRILWLLEEVGLPYEIKVYARDPQTNLAPEALARIHPLGKSPVITDGDTVVAESGAIVEYLIETYAPQWRPPAGSDEGHQYRYWMHFAEGTLMPPMVAKVVLDKARTKAKPFFVRWVANALIDKIMAAYFGPNIQRNLDFVEHYLSEHQWFAGEQPSGADVQMLFPLEASVARGAAARCPAIKAWVDRVHQREGYQRALQKGGQYDFA
ncbi:glutathione S-transferase [Aestuariibacter halophilus]|uniref:Glutathione S-transferase n=1 Tax=Fluctibacter halophilus TaxID=226011 RepID=A0ABS8GAF2_9ALTE|nr:glutathione S-transferase [Aestuariibacter halophilus]MCC2617575.1 glutathione S-transferase [Aestuariibacter halophilus]